MRKIPSCLSCCVAGNALGVISKFSDSSYDSSNLSGNNLRVCIAFVETIAEVLDFPYFHIAQAKLKCSLNTPDLFWSSNANDRGGYGWMVQHPSQCNLPGRSAMSITDLT